MEFKEQESKYWSNFYSEKTIAYKANRDLPYHHHYKKYLFDLNNNAKILELACGIRCDGIELAKTGKKVFETDIAEEAVSKAKIIYDQLGLLDNAEFLVCDGEKMPFSDNYFDAVFISASFHHLPNPVLALKEMKRVVKNDCYIILGLEPNAWPYFTIYKILDPLKKIIRSKSNLKFHSIADDTTQGFTKKYFKELASEVDLKVIKIYREKYLNELYDSGLRLLNKLFKLKIKGSFRVQYFLSYLDLIISYIPIINLINWHWNVIYKKPNL